MEFLRDIVMILGLATAVVYLFNRLKAPSIIGLLVAGVLAGPHGLGLVREHHTIEVMAEVGVVLLLFTIGLEFSVSALVRLWRAVLVGGGAQVALTMGAVAGGAWALGRPPGEAVFVGMLAALSSTAIVLKLWQARGEMESPAGRTGLGILIFQDLAVVPMLIITPMLAAGGAAGGEAGAQRALWGLLVLAALVAAKWLAPRLMTMITATRDRELFLMAVVLMCLGVAWLTSLAGLSLALGAFAAGLIISESPYAHQAMAGVLPLRDLFTGLFFISVGMLLDVGFVVANPLLVAGLLAGVVLLKSITGGVAALASGAPPRAAAAAGLSLSQVGEFSFVLAQAGLAAGLLDGRPYQAFLAVAVLSMAFTPGLMALGGRLQRRWPAHGPAAGAAAKGDAAADHTQGLEGHIIVVGYGVGGRHVARAAALAGLRHVVLELNAETVRRESAQGEPIFFGDAIHASVLEHAGAARANALVVTIADPVATRRIVAVARSLSPELFIIARTRYLAELEPLVRLGADEVVPEEFETSLEIFVRLLAHLEVPAAEMERLAGRLRARGYLEMRAAAADEASSCALGALEEAFPGQEAATLAVAPGSRAAGATLGQLDLRGRAGVNVLAVHRRGGGLETSPGPDTRLGNGDQVVVLGPPGAVTSCARLLTLPAAKG